jgi:hypothetical protein
MNQLTGERIACAAGLVKPSGRRDGGGRGAGVHVRAMRGGGVAVTVIIAPIPRFTVATAKNPVPISPGMFTMPSLLRVAARPTMSGTGAAEADRSSVLSPWTVSAKAVFAHPKPS